ncbi:MAG: carbohydrate ABC transporter permease [Betaproteobacteria bacterium AqS2]|uniref:Carbohydrate ABC transporter permease n=1 Tax=Candidatus Amphirhobacter heronislandensis TaxID=1732024 RepID=A0A930UCR4_9GAMM|nr:carbohydrate ABC transporter permease [Betaproteobacteria bacterium AqS2]
MAAGVAVAPPLGPAAVAGAAASLACAWRWRWSRRARLALAAGIFAFTLLALNGGVFIDAPWRDTPLLRAAVVALVAWSAVATLSRLRLDAATRYQTEKTLLAFGKGGGLAVLTLLVALPFYVMVMTSLKSQQALLADPLDYSIDLGQAPAKLFVSYIELFTEYHFGTFLWNSLLVSVATVALTLAFAIPGAYAAARLRFRGQQVLTQSILLIYMIPAIVLVIPLYAVFSQLGLRNSLYGLLVVYPATTIPVALYMLQGYFRGLPAELEEAGLLDGLRRPGVIAKITLPLSLPALAAVGLYVFMIAWNEFLFAFMFLDDIEIFTLSRGVVSLNSSEVPRQHLMAAAVVATVPVLLLFLACERFLVTGLTAGGVKG